MLCRPAAQPRPSTPRRRIRRAAGAALAGVALTLVGGAGVVGSGAVAHAAAGPIVNIWVPYWATTAGATRFMPHGPVMNEVSPFFLSAVADGTIVRVDSGSVMAATIKAARDDGLKVIPTITDGAGKGGMAAILADPTRRANHIANVVSIALNGIGGSGGFDGIDLDYEAFAFTDGASTWAATMPNWVQFVKELSGALHVQGKVLTVTIPPVWNATARATGNTTKDYWVYAQDQILASVDRLRLMVYDWSPGTPSATAPINWVQQVVTYSNAVADATGQPRSKFELGVPAYGRHWRRSVNGMPCPDSTRVSTLSVTTINAPGIAPDGVTPQRDDTTGEMTFSWNETSTGLHTFSTATIAPPVLPASPPPVIVEADGNAPAVRLGPPPATVTCTVKHTVFYPDAASIAQKAQVAVASGWAGVIIWAAGYESDDVYDALGAID
ncbi:MAG: glycosyl hydrolase family 18 protein [Ilumatobacteraceae bacterium]